MESRFSYILIKFNSNSSSQSIDFLESSLLGSADKRNANRP